MGIAQQVQVLQRAAMLSQEAEVSFVQRMNRRDQHSIFSAKRIFEVMKAGIAGSAVTAINALKD